MSTTEFPEAEVAYRCDRCGKLFDSSVNVQDHGQKEHIKSTPDDDFRSWISGTSTPAEDREEEAAKTERST